jgi:Mg-chelatase subunit ChlD
MSRRFIPFLLIVAAAHGQPIKLKGVDVRLVSCRPVSTVPCFRLKLLVTGGQGSATAIAVPPPEQLAQSLKVTVAGSHIIPFYARASSAQNRLAENSRATLILVDVSGSMNNRLPSAGKQTRFQAAQAALQEFLHGFEAGKDRVAIVPFESHDVVRRIRSAPFVEAQAEAQRLIADLPYPSHLNNTALYAAIDAGLDVLARQKQLHPQDEQLLVVLTDGRDDVQAGDDPELLRHPIPVEVLAEKIRSFSGQTLAVGFGDRREIDEAVLHRISKRVEVAEDASTLSGIFGTARSLLSSQLQVTIASPFPDLASLTGRSLDMDVTWALPGEQYAQTEKPLKWNAGDMGVSYEGVCDDAERRAVPRTWEWISVWRPALVFVALGAVLLVMWLWVPRLIWPPTPSSGIRPVRSNLGGPARRDERQAGPRPPVRGADDRTVVQRDPDTFKSRLRRDQD